MRSQPKPMRSSTPGAKFSTSTSQALHQRLEHLLALRILGVEGDRALVVVQHREIEAVHIRNVAQLAARDVADAGPLHFDHVGAEPGEKLGAGGAGLHVGEIEDADAFQSLHRIVPFVERFAIEQRYFLRSLLCGLRLPILPLSLPAAGSMTALMRVGLPESSAASTARFSSSGVVAWAPLPPKASMILS